MHKVGSTYEKPCDRQQVGLEDERSHWGPMSALQRGRISLSSAGRSELPGYFPAQKWVANFFHCGRGRARVVRPSIFPQRGSLGGPVNPGDGLTAA
jgi:hypothetical protein